MDFEVYGELRNNLPSVKIVQVVHVLEGDARSRAKNCSVRDALLLDSGNPTLAVKVLGGTGNRHDWNLSREIVASVGVPVFLAGGLKPANVGEAIRTVQPYGLDLCTA